jgi:hypothetical protein
MRNPEVKTSVFSLHPVDYASQRLVSSNRKFYLEILRGVALKKCTFDMAFGRLSIVYTCLVSFDWLLPVRLRLLAQ